MTMFCVVVVYLQDSSCSRALRFHSARAVPQEIYEMPSLTERSHKASLERLLVQFSYSWQREYYNKRYHLKYKKTDNCTQAEWIQGLWIKRASTITGLPFFYLAPAPSA